MSSRSTTYFDEGRANILSRVFLGEKAKWITPFVWLLLIALLALNDSNVNPLIGTVIWFVGLFTLAIGWGIWHWATTTEAQRKAENRSRYSSSDDDPYTWGYWIFLPGSLLILMTFGLFLLGPFGANKGYIVLSGPTGARAVLNNVITFHVPLSESVSRWDVSHTVVITPTAQTLDGKKITADVKVVLATDDNPDAVVALSAKLGSPVIYAQNLQMAVEREFGKAVGRYKLENLPGNLILEDYVGTQIGLEGLRTRWSGAVVITNIHRFADVQK